MSALTGRKIYHLLGITATKTEINKLHNATGGTAGANQVVVTDANSNVTGLALTSPTISGNITLSTTTFVVGSSTDGIIAHSGGGAGSATPLVSSLNRISTAAAAHDSVKLPTALGGIEISIDNDGANSIDIYPAGTDTVEDGAGPITIISGADVTLVCPVTGKWYLQGSGASSLVYTTAPVTANASTTYANVTGLVQTVVPGTYKFTAVLPSTVASGTGGIKYAFNYTTAVLSGLEATSLGFTSAAVAVQHTTTTTTQTDLFSQAAVVIMTLLEGSFVVTTGGTIQIQMAQSASNASNTIALLGGTFTVSRIF